MEIKSPTINPCSYNGNTKRRGKEREDKPDTPELLVWLCVCLKVCLHDTKGLSLEDSATTGSQLRMFLFLSFNRRKQEKNPKSL